MLSKEYLETARTLLRVARNMTDETVADRLKALAEDYERRGQRTSELEAKALAPRSAHGQDEERTPNSGLLRQ